MKMCLKLVSINNIASKTLQKHKEKQNISNINKNVCESSARRKKECVTILITCNMLMYLAVVATLLTCCNVMLLLVGINA